MAEGWGITLGNATSKKWPRSYKQEIFTEYGVPYRMTAYIEMLKKYENGDTDIIHEGICELKFDMSQLEGDDLADAVILQEVMTRIIGRRYAQWKLEQESLPAEE